MWIMENERKNAGKEKRKKERKERIKRVFVSNCYFKFPPWRWQKHFVPEIFVISCLRQFSRNGSMEPIKVELIIKSVSIHLHVFFFPFPFFNISVGLNLIPSSYIYIYIYCTWFDTNPQSDLVTSNTVAVVIIVGKYMAKWNIILDLAVWIFHSANTFGKGIHPTILSSGIGEL